MWKSDCKGFKSVCYNSEIQILNSDTIRQFFLLKLREVFRIQYRIRNQEVNIVKYYETNSNTHLKVCRLKFCLNPKLSSHGIYIPNGCKDFKGFLELFYWNEANSNKPLKNRIKSLELRDYFYLFLILKNIFVYFYFISIEASSRNLL